MPVRLAAALPTRDVVKLKKLFNQAYHSLCDRGGCLKDKVVIWLCSLIVPGCSCIYFRSKNYTTLYTDPLQRNHYRNILSRRLLCTLFRTERSRTTPCPEEHPRGSHIT